MKKITIIIFTLSVLLFAACSSNNGKSHEHSKEEQHSSHSHDKGDSHMKHMNEVREKLKKELGDQYDMPVPEATPEQIALGKKIYYERCAKCHGEQGKGDGPTGIGLRVPPADFTDKEHATFYSEEGRKQIIRKGILGTVMFGWEDKLSEKEIDAVYAFVKMFLNSSDDLQSSDEFKTNDGHNHQH